MSACRVGGSGGQGGHSAGRGPAAKGRPLPAVAHPHRFTADVVDIYYESDQVVEEDQELQDFVSDVFMYGMRGRKASGRAAACGQGQGRGWGQRRGPGGAAWLPQGPALSQASLNPSRAGSSCPST